MAIATSSSSVFENTDALIAGWVDDSAPYSITRAIDADGTGRIAQLDPDSLEPIGEPFPGDDLRRSTVGWSPSVLKGNERGARDH